MQTTRQPYSIAHTRIAYTQVHRLTGTPPMRTTLPPSSGPSQPTGVHTPDVNSQQRHVTATTMSHSDELMGTSRDIQNRAQRLNREAEIKLQMRELQRELMEVRSSSTPSSIRSTDFLGFNPSNQPATDNLTSTRSDPEQQIDGETFQVQAVVHTAPTSAPPSPAVGTATADEHDVHDHSIQQQRYEDEVCAPQVNDVYASPGPTNADRLHHHVHFQPAHVAPQPVASRMQTTYITGQPMQPHCAIDPTTNQREQQALYARGVPAEVRPSSAVQLQMQYTRVNKAGVLMQQPYVNNTGPMPMAANSVPCMIAAAPPHVSYVIANDAQHAALPYMVRTPQPATMHIGGPAMLMGGTAPQYYANVVAPVAGAQPGPTFAPYVQPARVTNTQRAYHQAPLYQATVPMPEAVVYNGAASGYDNNAARYDQTAASHDSGAAGYSDPTVNYGVAPQSTQPCPRSGQRGAEFQHRARRAAHDRRGQELPQFSGAPEDWPQFFCAYETTTQEYGYTDLENMGRLQRALTGDAKQRIRGILIKPQHVDKSMQILAKAFGRPDILAESQLKEIRKIPKINPNRLNDMISYSMSVDSLVSLLDAPETEHLLNNYLLLKELTAKLPTNDQRKWAAVARRIGPNPSIRDFAEWLSDAADDIANIRTEGIYEETAKSTYCRRAISRRRVV